MAQIVPDQGGKSGMIRWDENDWLAGLIPQYSPSSTGIAGTLTYGTGFAFARNIDPFRNPGYLQPGLAGVDATHASVVTTYLKNGVVNGTTAYAIGGALLHSITSLATTPSITSPALHTISAHSGHSAVDGNDVAIYYIGGTKYLFYSWRDQASSVYFDGDLGRYDLNATFVDNFGSGTAGGGISVTGITQVAGVATATVSSTVGISTGDIIYIAGANEAGYNGNFSVTVTSATTFTYSVNPATASPATGTITYKIGLSADPHPMIVGDDNVLYIANSRYVAAFNGQSGTNGLWNGNALDLPLGYIITSFAKIKNYLVIYAYKSSAGSGNTFYRGESTAFFWDYVSDSFTYAYPLQGNYVSGGFTYKSLVGCFVQGRSPKIGDDKTSRLLLFNGDGFDPVFSFKENIPEYGGVEVAGNTVYFLAGINGGNSVIYEYCSPYIEEYVLGQTGQLGQSKAKNHITETSGDQSGMLKNFAGGVLYASSGATTSGGLQYFSGGYANSPTVVLPQVNISSGKYSQCRFNLVKIYWGPASVDHTITVNFVTDRNAVSTTVVSNFGNFTNMETKYEEDSSGNPLPMFSSVAPSISWNIISSNNPPPTIQAIEVYYEYRNL